MGSSDPLKIYYILGIKRFLETDWQETLLNQSSKNHFDLTLDFNFKEEKEILSEVPNAFAYQRILETEKAGYLIRQFFFSSLYDRIRFINSAIFFYKSNLLS